jgi:hypothetical protein
MTEWENGKMDTWTDVEEYLPELYGDKRAIFDEVGYS